MKLETFFYNFELLTDAPNTVVKLREIILQLAVRGKLVPQNPSDEPTSMLLEKVRRERKFLVEQNKIPKTREPKNKITLDEIPYDIPLNWLWVRLAEVGHEWGQKKPNIDFTYIDVSTIDKEQGVISDEVNILQPHEAPSRARKIVKERTVIYSTVRPYLLNIAIVDRQFQPEPIVSTAFAIIHPFTGIHNKYLYYYLRSQPFIEYVQTQMTGMAYPAINDTNLFKGLFPLPPTQEQKRIVEKCDRLLSICDEIEKRQQQRQESIVRMNESAITQLLSSQNPDEFRQHWQRICNNFDLLYSIPETIPKLRQVILQLAVQGKLVPQDPNDEPACVLLAGIASAKKQLIEKGRIKNALISILERDDIPYKVPNTWSWVRFGAVILDIEAGVSPLCEKRPKDNQEWGVIKISAVSWDKFDSNENKALPVGVEPRKEFEIQVGDFLISRANTSQLVGKSVVVENTSPRLLLNDKTLRVFFTDFSDKKFFNLYNNSLAARVYYAEQGTGTSYSMRNITREQIRNIPVPVPPLAEQKRIVAKVDRLMSLCDTLEAKLKEARSHSETLMEVAAKQILTA